MLLSRALRVLLGAISVGLLVLVLTTALFGTSLELLNFAPTFVYVIFWLGLPLLSVISRRRLARPEPVAGDRRRDGVDDRARGPQPRSRCSSRPQRFGRYPAALALFAFVALELAHPRPDYPRTVGVAVALYTYWALAGMAVFGRETWTRGGEGFAVAFELLSRIAPFAVRDGRIVVRWPVTGLGGPTPFAGRSSSSR